ncbi:unnamed protein product [Cunninghamella echinulata]
MADLTEQQKLERRRLKRQQKILQSAENRLGKITGTAFPDRISPVPSPSSSVTLLRHQSSISSIRSISSQVQQQQQERRQSQTVDINNNNNNNNNEENIEIAEHFPASNDIRRRTYDTYNKPILEDIKSVTSSTTTALNNSFLKPSSSSQSSLFSNDFMEPELLSSSPSSSTKPISKPPKLSLVNTLMMRKLYRQSHHHKLDPTLKYWNVLHFISMVWLTLCAFYAEWSRSGDLHHFSFFLHEQNQTMVQFPLFRHFVIIELLLFGAYSLYHPKEQYPPPEDDFTLIASQLPAPYDHIVTTILDYRRSVFCLIQDISIIVFMIGFIQVFTAVF